MTDLYAVQRLFRAGEVSRAETEIAAFVARRFAIDVASVAIRIDRLSLNSVNGTILSTGGEKFFFKFHLEEDEDAIQEYYAAGVLQRAGYPVDAPIHASTEPGEQFVIYRFKEAERMADVCRTLDRETVGDGAAGSPRFEAVVAAQRDLERLNARIALETMQTPEPGAYADEAIFQLFYWRLVDRSGDEITYPGGRLREFYTGKTVALPGGGSIGYDRLAGMRWRVNDLRYPTTLADAFDAAERFMRPGAHDGFAACTAHGDAHNGNVWVNDAGDGAASLSLFDPAFASETIPVLLADVKCLFHNIFAHPDWLYDAADADPRLEIAAAIEDDEIAVTHNWGLSPLRRRFLAAKASDFWIPVLHGLKAKGVLQDWWEAYVRAALFCCPTLVMNLCAGAGTAQNQHTEKTSLLAFSTAIAMAAAPEDDEDDLSAFFQTVHTGLSG